MSNGMLSISAKDIAAGRKKGTVAKRSSSLFFQRKTLCYIRKLFTFGNNILFSHQFGQLAFSHIPDGNDPAFLLISGC